MAERVGFEPTVPLLAHVISSHADSAALAPLREWLPGFPANKPLFEAGFLWEGIMSKSHINYFFTSCLYW